MPEAGAVPPALGTTRQEPATRSGRTTGVMGQPQSLAAPAVHLGTEFGSPARHARCLATGILKVVASLFALGFVASACGRVLPEPSPCPGAPLACIARSIGCDAALAVSPICDATTEVWSCPSGTQPYRRAADHPTTCLPFHDPEGPVSQLGGSLVRIPVDSGRCIWLAETVLTTAGSTVRNVAFDQDLSVPFGSCPTSESLLGGSPVSSVAIDGDDDPSLLVQVDGGYRIGGVTKVFYRLFRAAPSDPTSSFGVVELGSGLGVWDAANQRIILNFYTAKRFCEVLLMTLQRHETAFGVLETDVQKRVMPSARVQQAPPRS